MKNYFFCAFTEMGDDAVCNPNAKRYSFGIVQAHISSPDDAEDCFVAIAKQLACRRDRMVFLSLSVL